MYQIYYELSKVEMHAIQTSGIAYETFNSSLCRVCEGEVDDPRPWCEIIRKWSTFHPEFFYPENLRLLSLEIKDRAAIKFHDIGLRIVKINKKLGFEVFVGGGQGRSPFVLKK